MEYEQFEALLPVLGQGKMELGLDATRRLMSLFDNPQDSLPTIHIAGTNGKGSTAMMMATILEEAGYKVGLFTSPALVDFNERIRINREPISDEQLIWAAEAVRKKTAEIDIHFTEFELFSAMGWLVFAEAECDIIILEVGLGGRKDATNIVKKPLLTLIAKIALDHQQYLGETIYEIAGEKAGILKADVPLILYPQVSEAKRSILEKATALNSPVTEVDEAQLEFELSNSRQQNFKYKGEQYQIQLLEAHQIVNACMAIEAMHALRQIDGWHIEDEAIKNGLSKTVWPARFEWIQEQPNIIIDGSHNVDGIIQLRHNLVRYFPDSPRIAIIGMLKDKDFHQVLSEILPLFDKIITVAPNTPRALASDTLAEEIAGFNIQSKDAIVATSDYQAAYDLSVKWAKEYNDDAVICIFGSFYYVGYMRQIIKKNQIEMRN